MNLTNKITSLPREMVGDKHEAKEFFHTVYRCIKHDEITDSYHYRGYDFDYFKAGISFVPGVHNAYLLVDKHNHKNWLFNYGDPEERWAEFLKQKKGC